MKRPRLVTLIAIFGSLAVTVPATAASYTWKNLYDHPVLNQIGNNPEIGNESQFLKVRDISSSNGLRTLTVNPGQELALTAYFDNGANKPSLAANNTRIQFAVPSGRAKDFTIKATLSADNTQPKSLTDQVDVNSTEAVQLSVEAGSVRLWNNQLRGAAISDEAYKSGTQLGYDKLDGVLPGGPAYSGYVTLKVKVLGSDTVANTGPGDVIGLFAGASAAGTAYHMLRTSRRR